MFWIDHIAEDRLSVWFGPDWVQDFNSLEDAITFIEEMQKDG